MDELRQFPKGMPEIIPRITPAEIDEFKGERISAPFLGALINIMNALGAFGGEQLPKWKIPHLMYETSRRDSQPLSVPSSGKRDEYDRTAEDRLNRISFNGVRLIEKEVNFFRVCLGRIFHEENVKRLHDADIFSDPPTTVIQNLLADIPPVAVGSVDPLIALIALALADQEPIEIILKPHVQRGDRNIVSERYPPEQYHYESGETDILKLKGGYQFRILVPKEVSKIKPLAVSFTYAPGVYVAKEGVLRIDTRGSILTNVQPTDDETGMKIQEDAGPWRISRKPNKPFRLSNEPGRSGILVISDVGERWERLFPDGCDENALCDDDYRHLYTVLANLAATGNAPKLGVKLYEV